MSLYATSTTALKTTSRSAEGQRDVEARLELLVDGQREGLRLAAHVAGEDDRRPELPDPAGEGQDRPGGQPAGGQRQRDPAEGAARRRAQRPRGVEQGRIDRRERGDPLADVERRATKATARTTAHCVKGRTMPASDSAGPSRPPVPKAASSAIPATAGGSTSGSSTRVISRPRPRKRRVPSR